MTIGSLFSGIGGLELGLEMCGLGPVKWQCEIDPYARAVLRKHWPQAAQYEDVRQLDGTAEPVDIICGGSPCQDISVAGKGAGITGKRSGLWKEYARVVGLLQPSVVFVENVAALRTRGLDVVLGDLAELGYDAEWSCFRAAEVGAPHRRNRLFLLAYANRAELRKQCWGSIRENGSSAVVAGHAGPPWVAPASQWRWTFDGGGWTAEPPVCGVDDGVPRRVDRNRCLGNAVVPQCAAYAWRTLMERACAS